MSERRLTARQDRFIDELVACRNRTLAAVRAGYSPRNAPYAGSRTLALPYVREEYERRRAEQRELDKQDREATLDEMRRLAFFDILDLFDQSTGEIRKLSEMPAAARRALRGIKIRRYVAKTKGGERFEVLDVKLPDKLRALELLGREVGLFAETHRHTGAGGGPIEVQHVTLTEQERAARVTEIMNRAASRAVETQLPYRERRR